MKAYPFMHKHPTSGQTTIEEGMDLRDWFAGIAMQADMTQGIHEYDFVQTAARSYKMADAMMKQREIKEIPNE
jgi:hypothetical protein